MSSSDIALAPVADASAWRGADIAGETAWRHRLTADEIEDIARALDMCADIPIHAIERREFPLPILAPTLARLREYSRTGRGFFLIHGLPADRFDERARERLFWGIGTHLGHAVSQNAHGEMLSGW